MFHNFIVYPLIGSSREDRYGLNHPIALNHLTHLFFKLRRISFNDFELLIKNFFRTIQVLHLSGEGEEEYVNANRWEGLISSSMPFLRVFDIDIQTRVKQSFIKQFDEFKSPFWLDRQWSFVHQGQLSRNWYASNLYFNKSLQV